MARSNDRERSSRRVAKDSTRRTKKKVCVFCKENIAYVDYKDVSLLRKFMSDRGKIRARRVSGNCAQHQRAVAVAIKTSRELALLPYTQRTTTERPGARTSRGREAGGREAREAAGREGAARASERAQGAVASEEEAAAGAEGDVTPGEDTGATAAATARSEAVR